MGYYFKNKDYTETNDKLDKLFSDKDTFKNVYEFFKIFHQTLDTPVEICYNIITLLKEVYICVGHSPNYW